MGKNERRKRQPEQLHVLQRPFVVVGNTSGAQFGVQTIGQGIPQSSDTTAWTALGFEDRDVVASLGEFISGRQPRQACPDEDDSLRWSRTNEFLRKARQNVE